MPLIAALGFFPRGGRVKEGAPAAEAAADLKAQSRKERAGLEECGKATAAGAQIKATRKGTGGAGARSQGQGALAGTGTTSDAEENQPKASKCPKCFP